MAPGGQGSTASEEDPNWVPPPLGTEQEPTVLVTGVDTFIGSHVGLCFLHNNFKVRGTITAKSNFKRLAQLKKAYGDMFNFIHIVEWDCIDQKRFGNLCNGVRFIVHAHDWFADDRSYAMRGQPA